MGKETHRQKFQKKETIPEITNQALDEITDRELTAMGQQAEDAGGAAITLNINKRRSDFSQEGTLASKHVSRTHFTRPGAEYCSRSQYAVGY